MRRRTIRVVVSKGSGIRTLLLLLGLLLLSAFIPWLLIPVGCYMVYKVGTWLRRAIKSARWPKPNAKSNPHSSTSLVGDIQVYELDGVGPALVVKNGVEALGLGCLTVKSLGGGRIAELLSAVEATAKTGFESNLIVSRRSGEEGVGLMLMVKARRIIDDSFQRIAGEVVDDVVKGLTAAMGAVKARLPRAELQVLEFDELVKAVRGVVA